MPSNIEYERSAIKNKASPKTDLTRGRLALPLCDTNILHANGFTNNTTKATGGEEHASLVVICFQIIM